MRRNLAIVFAVACVIGVLSACTSSSDTGRAPVTTGGGGPRGTSAPRGTVPSADPAKAEAVRTIVKQQMDELHLKAAIVKVSIDGKPIITEAFGQSTANIPATTDMSFRNGAVAISYVSTLLLKLVDEKKVGFDDKVAKYLPDMKYANEVTLGQLAQMTSGIYDYVQDDGFITQVYANPWRQWKPEELADIALSHPLQYPPGTNWSYGHSNYVILGLALEKATGQKMPDLLQQKIFDPLNIHNTIDPNSPFIPEPALNAFDSERRTALKIPAGVPFYEESTGWSPSWSITNGAIQVTTIDDMHDSWTAIGSGKLLSPESYKVLTEPKMKGVTKTIDGCPTCTAFTDFYSYGTGIVLSGNWLMQNPLFFGYGGAAAYLPSQKITIAVEATLLPEGFSSETGTAPNPADRMWRKIGQELAPNDKPPDPPQR